MEAMTHNDPTLRRAYVAVLFSGFAFIALFLALGLRAEAVGALAGSLLGLANLYTLARAVTALLEGRSASWGLVVFVKFVALFGVAYMLLAYGALDVVGFSVGIGALPVGIVVAASLPVPASAKPHSSSSAPLKSETDHA